MVVYLVPADIGKIYVEFYTYTYVFTTYVLIGYHEQK